MDADLLRGSLVCLTVEEPETMAEAITHWEKDSEYLRLASLGPAYPNSVKKITAWLEEDQGREKPDFYSFAIRTLAEHQLIGLCVLSGISASHGEAFVGMGIGYREYWGKGYGADALDVILHFAFLELNLRRISLDTAAYNLRAIHSSEKAGFVHEGRQRKTDCRDGQRWDAIFMGILREEWLARQFYKKNEMGEEPGADG